jgi:hypothetical protein
VDQPKLENKEREGFGQVRNKKQMNIQNNVNAMCKDKQVRKMMVIC